MSHLIPKIATIAGSVALLALLGISTDAQAAARKKHHVRNPAPVSQSVRSSYGYEVPRAYDFQPSGSYGRRAPGTGILGGGPAAGWGGPP